MLPAFFANEEFFRSLIQHITALRYPPEKLHIYFLPGEIDDNYNNFAFEILRNPAAVGLGGCDVQIVNYPALPNPEHAMTKPYSTNLALADIQRRREARDARVRQAYQMLMGRAAQTVTATGATGSRQLSLRELLRGDYTIIYDTEDQPEPYQLLMQAESWINATGLVERAADFLEQAGAFQQLWNQKRVEQELKKFDAALYRDLKAMGVECDLRRYRVNLLAQGVPVTSDALKEEFLD